MTCLQPPAIALRFYVSLIMASSPANPTLFPILNPGMRLSREMGCESRAVLMSVRHFAVSHEPPQCRPHSDSC